MRYYQILLEYRLLNQLKIERHIGGFHALVPIKDKIFKLLAKDRQFHQKVTPYDLEKWYQIQGMHQEPGSPFVSSLSPNGPLEREKEFNLKDAEAGTLVNIDIDALFDKLGHIADWLGDNECGEIGGATRYRQARGAGSIDQMYNMADAYFRAKNKKLIGEEDWAGIKEIIAYEDGHKWIQLTSKKALQREGKLMDHCIASYWPRIEPGYYRAYSLRDKENMPLVTIGATELEMMYKYKSPQPAIKRPARWIIDQIQGPSNTNVDRKYASEINDFEKYLTASERNDLVKYEKDIAAL